MWNASAIVRAMSSVRCGTDVSVEWKTGANGESFPTAPSPDNNAETSAGRWRVSATAWRTRGSLNGAWSLRIDSSRCWEACSLMIL